MKDDSIRLECEESISEYKQDMRESWPCQPIFDESTVVFGVDTLEYLMNRERTYAPDPYYMGIQSNIDPIKRVFLFDWISNVCIDLHLSRETYYLTMNYIDRYLSKIANIKLFDL